MTVVLTAACASKCAYLVIAELIDVTAPVGPWADVESRRQRRSERPRPDGRGAANAVLVTLAVLTLIGGLALALDLFDLRPVLGLDLITVLLIGVGAGLTIFARARW